MKALVLEPRTASLGCFFVWLVWFVFGFAAHLPSAVKVGSPNHWTAREFLGLTLKRISSR